MTSRKAETSRSASQATVASKKAAKSKVAERKAEPSRPMTLATADTLDIDDVVAKLRAYKAPREVVAKTAEKPDPTELQLSDSDRGSSTKADSPLPFQGSAKSMNGPPPPNHAKGDDQSEKDKAAASPSEAQPFTSSPPQLPSKAALSENASDDLELPAPAYPKMMGNSRDEVSRADSPSHQALDKVSRERILLEAFSKGWRPADLRSASAGSSHPADSLSPPDGEAQSPAQGEDQAEVPSAFTTSRNRD